MKICTACNASYTDETLSFCPVDGTTLTPQKDISLDQVPFAYEMSDWSDKAGSEPDDANAFKYPEPPTAAFSQPLPSPSPNISSASPKNANRQSVFPIVVGGVLAVAVFAVVILVMTPNNSRKSGQGTENPGKTFTLANGASVRAEPDGTPMGSSSGNVAVVTNAPSSANLTRTANTAASTNSSMVGKPISRKTDFTGVWQGKFSDEPTVLSITTQTGETFSGTLSKKGYIVKINGKIDFDKGTVEITETKVLQTPPNLNWNLGTNNGTVLDDGKSMSGTGRDKNGSYSWTFIKD